MSDTQTPRKDKRTPVTLKIKFKSATLEQFIERYSVDVSHGGIFIRTKDPLAVGTQMRFEFQLQDASPLIAGEGTVVWTREFDPTRAGVAPGMGVRFDKLGSDSQTVLDKILARKTRDSAEQRDGFAARGQPAKPAAPTAPSAAAVAASVVSAGRPAPTPTPAPARPVLAPTRPVPAPVAAKSKPAVGATPGAAKAPVARTMMGMPAVGKLAPPRAGFPEENSKDYTPLPKPMPFHGLDEEVSEDVFDQPTRVGVLDSLLMVEVEHARAASQAPEPETEAGVESVDLPVTPPAEAQLPTASVRRAVTAPLPARPAPTPTPAPEHDAEAEDAEQVTSVSVRPSLSTAAGAAPVVAPVPEPVAAASEPGPVKPEPVVAKPEPVPVPVPVKAAAKPAPAKPEPVKPKPIPEERPGTTTTPKARPRPVLAEEPAKGRSSMLWPAVGALAFVGAAAAVYFLVIRKPDDDTTITPDKTAALGEQPAAPAPPAATPPAPVAAVAPPASQPAVEIIPSPPVAAAHAPAPAGVDVDITSVPAGATVEVEGVAQAATPTRLAGLDGSKPVHLVFRADCYKEEKMTITPKAGVGVTARLRPMDRVVHVSSTPSDAAIFVDGISEGRSPVNVFLRGKLDPGQPHKFTFKKGGYDDSEVLLAPDVPCTMEKGVAAVTVAQALSQSAHVAAPRPTPSPSRPAAAPSHPHEKPAVVPPPTEGGIQVIDQSKPAEPAVAPTPEPSKPAEPVAPPVAKPAEPAAKPAEPAPTPSQPKETGAGDAPKPTPTPAAAPPPAAPTPAAPTAPAKPAEPAKPKPDCDPSPDAPAWARCPSL